MYTNAKIASWSFMRTKAMQEKDVVLDTIGDRIFHLLRTHGRADRGSDYSQLELVSWLNGETVAPDGRKYAVGTNKSTLNRIISDKMKSPPLEVLSAICDIFGVDLEWLGRGNTIQLDEKEKSDIFMQPEAGEIVLLMERMEVENRQIILYMAKHISRLDNELRQSDYELAKILARNIEGISAADRSRARLLLSQISANRREPRDLGASAQ